MNSSAIRFLLGHVLAIEGILLLLPAIVGAFYGENSGLIFLLVAAVCIILGLLMTRRRP